MEAFLKRFSVIFSTLLLIQCNIALLVNGERHQSKISDDQIIENQSTKLSSPNRNKRSFGFLGHVFGSIFGTSSLINLLGGCEILYPDLKVNTQKIQEYLPKFERGAKSFDAKWKIVNSSKEALTDFMGHVKTLQYHLDRMDKHKLQVMKIIDEQYQRKSAEIKNKIKSALNNLKPNQHMTPETYQSFFEKSNEDFLKYTKELEPIKEWLGVDIKYFYHMSKHTSTKMAREEAIKMPSLMEDALKKLDKNSNKYAVEKGSWDKFMAAATYSYFASSAVTAVAAFIGGPVATAATSFTLAAVGIGAIFSGIHGLAKTLDCKQRSIKLKEHVAELRHFGSKLDSLFPELEKVKTDIEKNQKKIHDVLVDEHFKWKLKEVYDLAKTTLPQSQITWEIQRKIRDYANGAFKNNVVTKYLVDELIGGINDTGSLIDCFTSKMLLIGSITSDCARGKTDAEKMWLAVHHFEQALLRKCPIPQTHQLTKVAFLELVRRLMQAQGKNGDCKFNLSPINEDICKDWFDYKQESEIYKKYAKFSRHTIQRELGNCRHGELISGIKDQICKMKDNRQTEYDVLNKFYRHDVNQLSTAYLNCFRSQLSLDEDDKVKICDGKSQFVPLKVVEEKFQKYVGVKDVYDNCKPDLVQCCYALRQKNRHLLSMLTTFYPSAPWGHLLMTCLTDMSMNLYGMNVKSEREHDLNQACNEAQFSYTYAKLHNDLSDKEMQKLLPVCKYIKH